MKKFCLTCGEQILLPTRSDKKFYPIPSTNGKYEIDRKGNVRNSRTKKLLAKKKIGNGLVKVYLDGKKISLSISRLLAEVFGRTFSSLTYPVVITRGNTRLVFDSKSSCARFLAKNLFYSVTGIRYYLSAKQPTIHGWNIFYLN